MGEIAASTLLPYGMRPEVAQRRITAFHKRFGDAHLYLAYHAAFPLALTPDLLYRLRANFQRDLHGKNLNIPWIAVADLLLSALCDEVGYELYEMNVAVRTELLNQLKADPKFGLLRVNELSNFLLKYVQQQLASHDRDVRDFAQSQYWTALAATRPSEAAQSIALTLSKLHPGDRAEFARLGSLIGTFAEPSPEFTELLAYARGMEQYARGDEAAAGAELGTMVEGRQAAQVGGVHLPIPERLRKETRTTSRRNFFISYHDADRAWAEWIAWQLEEAGYSILLQTWDFQPGSNFAEEMDKVTKAAEHIIVVLSPDYLNVLSTLPEWIVSFSQDPRSESERGILLAIQVRECISDLEELLGPIDYIDLMSLDDLEVREKLLSCVHRDESTEPVILSGFSSEIQRSVSEQPQFPGIPQKTKEQTPLVAPSIGKCPYCGAETRPGDNFCLDCGNRLLSATPSYQQATPLSDDATISGSDNWAQPIIDSDATQQAFGPDSNDRAVADRKGGPESLIGSLLAPSVISPWEPDLDASAMLPDAQVEAEVSVSSPPPADVDSTAATDLAKEQELKEGDTYYRARRYEEALATYERVIQMDPHNVHAYSNKGNTLRKLKRYKEALEAYEHALTLDPNSAFVWISEGKVFYSLKRYDEALVAYNRAIVINPNSAVIWASKGNVLYALKRYREALEAYESALTIKSDDASIWTAKGEVLYRQKRYREALEAYDRALAITPDDASIWIAKSNKLYKLKRYEEVLATYERILAIIPNNASIWSNKGNVLYQVERYDEALDAYNKALTITPRKARIWSDKGAVLYKLERYDEALEAYKFAQFLDPNDTSISHRYDMLRDRLRDLKRRQEEPERKQAPGQSKFEAPSSNDRPASSPGSGQPSYAISPRQAKNAEAKKAAGNKQFDVFLSHSHTDAEWVEKNLALRLVDEHGFRVWLDKWMLIPGQSFVQGMARGIDQAHCCAVCIGEHTPLGWFRQEIRRALNRQAKDPSFRVIAILLPGAKDVNVDDFLELNIWVDFRSSDTAYAFHVLVSSVRGEPPGRWAPKETPPMKTSVDVEAKLRELHRLKQENWVDPSISNEFQRIVLNKIWLEESEGQQE